MSIIVYSDIEIKNGMYYYDTKKSAWFGHWRSNSKIVNSGYPKSGALESVLTKIAIKSGYSKEIFIKKTIKNNHTHTENIPKKKTEKRKKTVSKKQNSTFISLF